MLPGILRENLFEDWPFGREFFSGGRDVFGKNESALMRADVRDTGSTYVISADVPGCRKEDISIRLEKGYLTVTANKNFARETKDEKDRYVRKERYEGFCSRSFFVGEELTEKDITAGLKDGILSLTVPKKELKAPEKAKYIEIQ